MRQFSVSKNRSELTALCNAVRVLITQRDYQQCEDLIRDAMRQYPHAPEPHNLLGILLEKECNHPAAMKHFRAAWALDPTYMPARNNLDMYGTFFSTGKCAYDESDCEKNII